MSRLAVTLLSLIAIAVFGAVVWTRWISVRPEVPPAPPRRSGPVEVRILELERRDFEVSVECFGSLLAARTARLAPEHSGRLVEVHPAWRPGAEVRAGDVLLRLDAELYEQESRRLRAVREEVRAGLEAARRETELAGQLVEGAEEALALARDEEERQVQLLALERISQSLVDRARLGVVEAESAGQNARARLRTARVMEGAAEAREAQSDAALASAEEATRRTALVAPFDGRLDGRPPGVGSFLPAGVPIVELHDLATLHLAANVPEVELGRVRIGQTARIELTARPGHALTGRVRAIAPALDPATRTGRVEIEVPQPAPPEAAFTDGGEVAAPPLVAGLFARARIDAGTRTDVLWIDRRHVQWRDGRAVAFVLEGDRARRRELELGEELEEGWVVAAGLTPGERLVTAPLDRLEDGRVCAVTSAASPGNAR